MGNVTPSPRACLLSISHRDTRGVPEGSLGTTYEIGQPPPVEAHLRRLEKFRLQCVARRFMPGERVKICLRKIRPQHFSVEIYQGKERAFYGGLVTCGSIWICPVCAAKISEQRRQELCQGLETWKARGGVVLMTTYTVPHYDFQGLFQVLAGFTKARKLMMNRRPWKGLKKRIGLVGTVRALEVTYGENGWHVHVHELLFLMPEKPVSCLQLQGEILSMWQAACQSAGMGTPNLHGVQVDDGAKAARYASKWGMEDELTKSHVKQGRGENLTPWDFLRREEEELFQEYVKAFKGKRQLVWSEGLRELLGLGKMESDEEVAGEVEEESVLLGSLEPYQWDVIQKAELRGELLRVAEVSGWGGVLDYIRNLLRVDDCPF